MSSLRGSGSWKQVASCELGPGQTCSTLDSRAGVPCLGAAGAACPSSHRKLFPLCLNSYYYWALLGSHQEMGTQGCTESGCRWKKVVKKTRRGAYRVLLDGAHTGDQETLQSLSFGWEGAQSEICKAAHLRLEPHCAAWTPQGWR